MEILERDGRSGWFRGGCFPGIPPRRSLGGDITRECLQEPDGSTVASTEAIGLAVASGSTASPVGASGSKGLPFAGAEQLRAIVVGGRPDGRGGVWVVLSSGVVLPGGGAAAYTWTYTSPAGGTAVLTLQGVLTAATGVGTWGTLSCSGALSGSVVVDFLDSQNGTAMGLSGTVAVVGSFFDAASGAAAAAPVPTVSFSPASRNEYTPGASSPLTMASARSTAIHYTLDGSTPTAASSAYSGPIIGRGFSDFVVEAYAVNGSASSRVSLRVYPGAGGS